MASLRCHGDSDCYKTQIIRNFHLYIIQLWSCFFHIFTLGDVINAQTWEVPPPPLKIQSSHLNICPPTAFFVLFVIKVMVLVAGRERDTVVS